MEVIIGSRKEEKALSVVKEAKEKLSDYDLSTMVGMTNEDAAKKGDVLILTVPLSAQKPTLEGIKEFVNDKIIYLNQGYSLLSDVVFEKDSLTDECLVITRVYSDSCLSFRDCKPEYVEWLNPLVYKYDK